MIATKEREREMTAHTCSDIKSLLDLEVDAQNIIPWHSALEIR